MAPRDIARLCALLEGHDGLGAPRPIAAREGHLALDVPAAMAEEAERALNAIATRIPMRRLGNTTHPTTHPITASSDSRESNTQ